MPPSNHTLAGLTNSYKLEDHLHEVLSTTLHVSFGAPGSKHSSNSTIGILLVSVANLTPGPPDS